MTRLEQQMNFLLELDKLKDIQRQTYLCHGKRKENDAEHSYHLALMAMILSEYAEQEIDVSKVMAMVLIHDIIEIDAGDTYAYDDIGNSTKREREEKAAERIFSLLPKDQGKYMRLLWEEFEEGNTPEAVFANTLDRIQPTMLNHTSGGKAWREHEISISQIEKRHENTKRGSHTLWEYAKTHYIEPNVSEKEKERAIINDRER